MPVIQNFQAFINGGGLVCPAGKPKIEWAVAEESGLFAECRASEKALPTWYQRLKNAQGTNVYRKLGTIKDVNLAQARKLARQVKAEHLVARKVEAAVAPVAAKHE